jgi:hypothetical protein
MQPDSIKAVYKYLKPYPLRDPTPEAKEREFVYQVSLCLQLDWLGHTFQDVIATDHAVVVTNIW